MPEYLVKWVGQAEIQPQLGFEATTISGGTIVLHCRPTGAFNCAATVLAAPPLQTFYGIDWTRGRTARLRREDGLLIAAIGVACLIEDTRGEFDDVTDEVVTATLDWLAWLLADETAYAECSCGSQTRFGARAEELAIMANWVNTARAVARNDVAGLMTAHRQLTRSPVWLAPPGEEAANGTNVANTAALLAQVCLGLSRSGGADAGRLANDGLGALELAEGWQPATSDATVARSLALRHLRAQLMGQVAIHADNHGTRRAVRSALAAYAGVEELHSSSGGCIAGGAAQLRAEANTLRHLLEPQSDPFTQTCHSPAKTRKPRPQLIIE